MGTLHDTKFISGAAYSLMEDGQIEQAIEAFGQHAQLLLLKMEQYKGEREKIDAINDDLQMVISFLRNLRVKFMDRHSNKFEPMKKEALEEELQHFPKIARDTITRMITYKFPRLTFSFYLTKKGILLYLYG